ncbi:hypothetical protein J4526_00555 [Desulfurococcaceae archaeon MEX13E-LK6-19]|nr:hypothetical protein J4526_00555 [Desulfurococcaceae archaeon MEX13E-LK6-19]
MYRIVVAVDEEGVHVKGARSADKLLFIDLDTRSRIVRENPLKQGLMGIVEDLLEELGPAVFICSEISDSDRFFFEENGVKVIVTPSNLVEELLEYIGPE